MRWPALQLGARGVAGARGHNASTALSNVTSGGSAAEMYLLAGYMYPEIRWFEPIEVAITVSSLTTWNIENVCTLTAHRAIYEANLDRVFGIIDLGSRLRGMAARAICIVGPHYVQSPQISGCACVKSLHTVYMATSGCGLLLQGCTSTRVIRAP